MLCCSKEAARQNSRQMDELAIPSERSYTIDQQIEIESSTRQQMKSRQR